MIKNNALGMTASFALAANAFMIPSTMSAPEIKGDGIEALRAVNPAALLQHQAAQSHGHIVRLPCSECEPKAVNMDLVLNFTLADNDQMLLLNDEPFLLALDQQLPAMNERKYPVMPSAAPDALVSFFTGSSLVHFMPQGFKNPLELQPYSTGSAVQSRRITASDDTDAELIDVDFHLDHGAHDGVSMRLLTNEEQQLRILDIVLKPAHGVAAQLVSGEDGDMDEEDEMAAPAHPKEGEQMFEILPISPHAPSSPNGLPAIPFMRHKPQVIDCHGLPLAICKMQTAIRMKFEQMHGAMSSALSGPKGLPHHRPCGRLSHGPPGVHIKGGVDKFTNPDGTSKFGPPHGHHHHHHHHSALHRAVRFLHRFVVGFVVPVMVGVAAGMTASLAGMVVGTGLAMLWFKLRRGGKKGGNGTIKLEEGDSEQTEALLKATEAAEERRDSEDTLPAYEEKQSEHQ